MQGEIRPRTTMTADGEREGRGALIVGWIDSECRERETC